LKNKKKKGNEKKKKPYLNRMKITMTTTTMQTFDNKRLKGKKKE
jgi:hypothetical protein